MNTLHNEKRRFDRIFHDANIRLKDQNSVEIQCKLLDISLNGCLISKQQEKPLYKVSDRINVSIILADELAIKTCAHIAFIGKDGHIGLQFDEIDIDSVTTLRRLVELNMGDSLMLERNLHALGSVKDTNPD
ncbi:MAG: PilZ domain-containing protein [Cycloclasticus sp.]|nr:hypothetical protein A9Q82_06410 [Cycloclasticus sp. 46_120_T64]